jgi:hypothetical protein
MIALRRIWIWLWLGSFVAARMLSHPMGNFSISHYARFTVKPQSIDLLYLIDMAEIPTFREKPLVDPNGNGAVEAGEEETYLSRKAEELAQGLAVKLNGKRVPLTRISQRLELVPGGLNLPTLKMALDLQIPLEAGQLKDVNLLEYEDKNFHGQAGWKEIVVQGHGIEQSSASDVDKSQQLTRYPEDPAIRPPEDLAATIRFKRAANIDPASNPANTPTSTKQPERLVSGFLPLGLFLAACGCGILAWRWYAGRRGA